MEVGARPSERRAGSSRYRPETREGAVFIALVFFGLLVWLANGVLIVILVSMAGLTSGDGWPILGFDPLGSAFGFGVIQVVLGRFSG